MKKLMQKDLKAISAGTHDIVKHNNVEFYDSGLLGTISVPPSTEGQIVHLTVEVTEKGGLLSKIFG